VISPAARLAAAYFVYFAAVGIFTPFWSPYLASVGFSALQISWVLGAAAGVRAIGPILIGWFADLNHPTRVLRFTALAALVCFAMLPAHPILSGFIAFAVLFSLTWNSLIPLLDVHTVSHLGAGSSRYGRIRLWGSLSFIASSWAAGMGFQWLGYEPFPWLLGALVLLTLAATLSIRPMTRLSASAVPEDFADSLRSRAAYVSLAVAALVAVSFGAYYTFFSLYLESNGYSRGTIGLLWAVGVAAEVAVFAMAHRLLSRFSIRSLFVMAAAGTALRWIAIALLVQHPWALTLSQLLHCLGFAVLHYAMVLTAQRLFPASLQSRGQAVFSSASYGLGGMVGNLLAGVIWVAFSPRASYVTAAFIVVCAAVLAGVGLRGTELDRAPGTMAR